MKLITFIATLLFCCQLTAQNFLIHPDFYDSLGVTSFQFHVEGEASFDASMLLEVKLLSKDSVHTELFTGSHDFSNPSQNTLTGFSYDAQNLQFSFPLGIYPNKEMELWIRSYVNHAIREEVLVIHFD